MCSSSLSPSRCLDLILGKDCATLKLFIENLVDFLFLALAYMRHVLNLVLRVVVRKIQMDSTALYNFLLPFFCEKPNNFHDCAEALKKNMAGLER